MTSSGVATINPSMLSILTTAFFKAGIIRDDEVIGADKRAMGLTILNEMIKTWQAQNIRVWTEEEGILFLQPNQYRYQLGLTGDNATDAWTYLETEASVASAAADTTVTLTSTTKVDGTTLAIGDTIGIELFGETVQWSTVTNVAGLVVTISTPLTAANYVGGKLFGYTSKLIRPLKISRAAAVQFGSAGRTDTETPMRVYSRQEYMDLPTKSNVGNPNLLFYAPKLPLGEMYVWPAAEDPDVAIRFTYSRPIYDFVLNSDTGDFPQEWQEALTSGLALRLAQAYQAPATRIQVLEALATATAQILISWDREPEAISFVPDLEG
jgi:hypothetical protein